MQGFVVNRFRGDRALLAPGLEMLRALTGRPTFGVVPYAEDLWLDEEDRPDPSAYRDPGRAGRRVTCCGWRSCRPATVEQPHGPGSAGGRAGRDDPVRLATRRRSPTPTSSWCPARGRRWTICTGFERRGIDSALLAATPMRAPDLGDLRWLSDVGRVDRRPRREQTRNGRRPRSSARRRQCSGPRRSWPAPRRRSADGSVVEGYEIHHGIVHRRAGTPFFADEGCRSGSVAGTSWHGLFENDAFRRSFPGRGGLARGRAFVPVARLSFGELREARFDRWPTWSRNIWTPMR